MMSDTATPRRAAADWFILLRESPDDAELRAAFAAWQAEAPSHADAWAEMTETAHIMAKVSPARAERSTPAGRRGYQRAPRTRRTPSRRWKPIAAAAAAAGAILLAVPSLSIRLQADHISAAGQVETIRLADGSAVVLGPESAIAVDYSADGRDIRLLSGQALFEVERDPARPFRVTARGVTTTVLGTGFDVRMIGDTTSVAVVHGRVRVEADRAPRLSRDLVAGDWIRLVPDAPPEAGRQAPALAGTWKTGRVIVRNRPIREAIDEIRPWYNGKIIVADRALGSRLITGTYDLHDPARSLDLILAPYGGRVTHVTPWLMIVTAG